MYTYFQSLGYKKKKVDATTMQYEQMFIKYSFQTR